MAAKDVQDSERVPELVPCGVANPGGQPCTKPKGHPKQHDPHSYGPPAENVLESVRQSINLAASQPVPERHEFKPIQEPRNPALPSDYCTFIADNSSGS